MNASEIQKNTGLQRIPPEQEAEVIFLFTHIFFTNKFKNHDFTQIRRMQSKYPDCEVCERIGSELKKVSIEFELESINFRLHGHDKSDKQCDYIVCWEDNWLNKPKDLEVIELLTEYNYYSPKIWVMSVGENSKCELSEIKDKWTWTVPTKSHKGDLILFYHSTPDKCIKDIFEIIGKLFPDDVPQEEALKWNKKKTDVFADVKRIAHIDSPVFLKELQSEEDLSKSPMVRARMQSRYDATKYWKNLYKLIVDKNPNLESKLVKFAPEKILN